jgi:hypothetical protein
VKFMAKTFKQKYARCPNCGSTNIQSEPLYAYEDEDDYGWDDANEPGNLAIFCVSCGHYLGEANTDLLNRSRAIQNDVLRRMRYNL